MTGSIVKFNIPESEKPWWTADLDAWLELTTPTPCVCWKITDEPREWRLEADYLYAHEQLWAEREGLA